MKERKKKEKKEEADRQVNHVYNLNLSQKWLRRILSSRIYCCVVR
jgi:hypothetical protein